MHHEPGVSRLEFVIPRGTLALGFLGHVSEPLHRLVFIDVVYSGAAQSHKVSKVSSET